MRLSLKEQHLIKQTIDSFDKEALVYLYLLFNSRLNKRCYYETQTNFIIASRIGING